MGEMGENKFYSIPNAPFPITKLGRLLLTLPSLYLLRILSIAVCLSTRFYYSFKNMPLVSLIPKLCSFREKQIKKFCLTLHSLGINFNPNSLVSWILSNIDVMHDWKFCTRIS
jgi:hypothetical protein